MPSSPAAAASPLAPAAITVTDLVQNALSSDTRRAFDSAHERGMTLFPFVHYFMNYTERARQLNGKPPLQVQEYLNCKRLLFAAFYDMDRNDDGYVAYNDIVDYLIQQRAIQSEIAKEFVFGVDKVFRFKCVSSSDNHTTQQSDKRQRHESTTTEADDDDDDNEGEEAMLSFDQPTVMRLMTGSRGAQRIGIATRSNELCFIDRNFEQVDSFSTAGVTRAPILDMDSTSVDELVVTAHTDRTVRVWSDRDSRGLNRNKWHEVHKHCCDAVPTSICAHPRTDRVFSGSSKGEINIWRFSNALIADYKKGERKAFDSVLLKSWSSGKLHSDAVKSLQCFHRVDRLASGSLDGAIAIIDIPRETELQRFRHSHGILSLAVCEDFSLLCSVGYHKNPCLWDYTTALRMPTLLVDSADPHHDTVHSVCIVEQASKLLATCDVSSKLKLWDLRMMRCVQSVRLDRENSATDAVSISMKRHRAASASAAVSLGGSGATAMLWSPWGTLLLTTASRKLLSVDEKQDILPRFMGSTPVVEIGFDFQTGMVLVLHDDGSVVGWLNGTKRLNLTNLTESGGEVVRCMVVFPRGRKVLLGTSRGHLLTLNVETGLIVEKTLIFEDSMAIKKISLGMYEAKPFVIATGNDGSIICWGHPLLPAHTVLPAVSPTVVTLGTTDGSVWVGTAEGVVLHNYLPESVCSPPLFSCEFPTPVHSMTLIPNMGVMFMVRGEGEVILFNANFEGALLLRVHIHTLIRCVAATYLVKKKPHIHSEGYVATGDEHGHLSIYHIGPKIVHHDEHIRKKSFHHATQRTLFRCPITAVAGMHHWHAFVVVAEDATGKIVDRHGIELVALTQQDTPWPHQELPLTTNAEHSKQVAELIHRFFASLRRRVKNKKEGAALERKRSIFARRASRAMSFSQGSPAAALSASAATVNEPATPIGEDTVVLLSSFTFRSSDEDMSPELTAAGENFSFRGPLMTSPLLPRAIAGARQNNFTAAEHASCGSSGAVTQQVSACSTPLPSTQRLRAAPPRFRKEAVRYSQGGFLTQRPSSASPRIPAPPPAASDACSTQRIIGENSVRKQAIATGLRVYTGQIAVVCTNDPTPITSTHRKSQERSESSSSMMVAEERECSNRVVLPVAIDKIEKTIALEEKQLPPSTLWAPIQRPPSPLHSRIQRSSPRRKLEDA